VEGYRTPILLREFSGRQILQQLLAILDYGKL
jgi:hypothetical protein